MTPYHEFISRPARQHRVTVDMSHRLSRDEVRRAFIYFVTVLQPTKSVHHTPNVESLSRMLYSVLTLRGTGYLFEEARSKSSDDVFGTEYSPFEDDGSTQSADLLEEERSGPSAEVLDFAERCTARLWTSKRIMEKPGRDVPGRSPAATSRTP